MPARTIFHVITYNEDNNKKQNATFLLDILYSKDLHRGREGEKGGWRWWSGGEDRESLTCAQKMCGI